MITRLIHLATQLTELAEQWRQEAELEKRRADTNAELAWQLRQDQLATEGVPEKQNLVSFPWTGGTAA